MDRSAYRRRRAQRRSNRRIANRPYYDVNTGEDTRRQPAKPPASGGSLTGAEPRESCRHLGKVPARRASTNGLSNMGTT
ncbi:hypothetical protein IAQ61_003215 [Plenodomus lingam]|uniref:uncharacterized protein n=1 Tax=Leptosphaeria maculans TaxID=5022 RepID=UPI003323FFE8|nr:hypothetical protein IAQ61_003215 [Plenodomus lingam]